MVTSGTCDYLTITAKHGTQEQAVCNAAYDAIVRGGEFDEYDEKPARALGYVGTKFATMFLGQNPDGTMFRASGALAAVAANLFAFLPGNHHVTRIDFQLTFRHGPGADDVAEIVCSDVRQANAKSKKPNPPKVRLISSFGEGDTCTIGSRSSEVFIRVYDKSREQRTDPLEGLWRYEVELKGERAPQAMRLWCSKTGDNSVVFEVVDYWCKDRGVPVPWEYEGSYHWPEVGRPATDAERKLQWLERNVKPSVDYLIHKGHRQLVLEALGLDFPEA